MRAPYSLSNYILIGVVALLLATGVSDGPLGLVSGDQFPRHSPQAIAKPASSTVAGTTDVDRSRKGDRLPVTRATPLTNTTIMLKNIGAPELTVGGASRGSVRPSTRIV